MSFLTRQLALILALLLSLSAPQFAIARTQMLAGPDAVLCIGGGLVAIMLDAEGKPAGPGHFCPDCAPSMVAVPVEPLVLLQPQRRALPVPVPQTALIHSEHSCGLPPARAPPVLI